MKQNIIHIGLDVDDTQYHGPTFNKDTGEVAEPLGLFAGPFSAFSGEMPPFAESVMKANIPHINLNVNQHDQISFITHQESTLRYKLSNCFASLSTP